MPLLAGKQAKSKMVNFTDEDKQKAILEEVLRHIPHEVLMSVIHEQLSYNTDQRIIMFIDVSGFTAMTETYSKHSKVGIDTLSYELNKYFTVMIDHILDNRGDVLKFAGDAILASWLGFSSCVEAVRCALEIASSCSNYLVTSGSYDYPDSVTSTSNGDESNNNFIKHLPENTSAINDACGLCNGNLSKIELNVRIVLTAGMSRYIHLISDMFNHFLFIGDVIDQLKEIEKDSEIRTVLLDRKFWTILTDQAQNCLSSHLMSMNQKWVKIKCLPKSDPNFRAIDFEEISSDVNHFNARSRSITNFLDESRDCLGQLAKLLIEPVIERISNLEPLKYSSEMRELSVCFINVRLKDETVVISCVESVICKMFEFVSAITRDYDGVLSKVVEFDKGLSFLCLFGLGTSDNPYMCSLDASVLMRAGLLGIDECVFEISIGVTSGIMYCGVVGHSDRHEYTTIGRKVNLAARIMCAYPNMVSCDQETMLHSKLNRECFNKLEFKRLKGIGEHIELYEYEKVVKSRGSFFTGEDIDVKYNGEIGFFGRRIELLTACCKLIQYMSNADFSSSFPSKQIPCSQDNRTSSYCLIFRGEDGSGRSALLRYLFQTLSLGSKDRDVFLMTCVSSRSSSRIFEYTGIVNILSRLLHMNEFEDNVDFKRQLYHRVLSSNDVSLNLRYFLRDLLLLRDEISITNTDQSDFVTPDQNTIKELIDLVTDFIKPRTFLLLIDDLHLMDEPSLRLLTRLSKPPQSIIIAASRSSPKLTQLTADSSNEQYVEFKTITSIKEVQMHALICKIFKVQSIEKGLLKVLYQRTRGMPMLCLEALLELRRSSLVAIKDLEADNRTSNSAANVSLFSIKPSKQRRSTAEPMASSSSKRNLLLDLFYDRDSDEQNSMVSNALRYLYCLSGNPDSLDMPTSIESAFMREHNRLTAFEKSLLANSAVLDTSFSKSYLFGTCRGNLTSNVFNSAIRVLFESQMLMCAYNNQTFSLSQIKCYCPNNPTNLPFFCRMLKISHSSIRSIVFSSMTRETVKYRRLNALYWLECQIPKAIMASMKFGAHLGKLTEAIKLPTVSFGSEKSTYRASFMNVLGIMRIKSYEQMMSLSILHPVFFNVSPMHRRLENSKDYCFGYDWQTPNMKNRSETFLTGRKQSLWGLVRRSVMRGILDTTVTEINVRAVQFGKKTVFKGQYANTFEIWRQLDVKTRLDYYPYSLCMSEEQRSITELNEHYVSSDSIFNQEKFDFDLETMKLDKRQDKGLSGSSQSIYVLYKQQFIQILEEIISHSSNIRDHSRVIYYSLQLALIYITNDRALKARALITSVEAIITQHQQTTPVILNCLSWLVKARFEQYITKNYYRAIECYQSCLSYILRDHLVFKENRMDEPMDDQIDESHSAVNNYELKEVRPAKSKIAITEKISLDDVKSSIVSIHLGQAIYIGAYRVFSQQKEIIGQTLDDVLESICHNLKLISSNTAIIDIQTVLAISEEYHRQYVKSFMVLGQHADETVQKLEILLNYLEQCMNITEKKSAKDIYAIVCNCYGFVLLKSNRNFEMAFEVILKAYKIFAQLSAVDHMAYVLPYLCMLAVKFEKLPLIIEHLSHFGDVLQQVSTFDTDVQRSLYIALHQALQIDMAYSYLVSFSSSKADIEILSGHLQALIAELTTKKHFLRDLPFLFYCVVVLCRQNVNEQYMKPAIELLKLAFNLLQTHIVGLATLDPLNQRTLLILSECQLLLKVRFDVRSLRRSSQVFVTQDLVNSISFIEPNFFYYAQYCALKACAYQLMISGDVDDEVDGHSVNVERQPSTVTKYHSSIKTAEILNSHPDILIIANEWKEKAVTTSRSSGSTSEQNHINSLLSLFECI